MHRIHVLVIGLCLLQWSCSNLSHRPDFTPRFVIDSFPPFSIPDNQEFTFGYLVVPENRKSNTFDTLRLPVYIFKSRHPNPQPDPVIYTVGGPGNATMVNAPYMQYYKYLDNRDLILFEQRGTRFSQPHLSCAAWARAIYQSNLPGTTESSADSILASAARFCRDSLTARGIDLNQYRTRQIAADLADLVTTLELDSFNLLTISYSTKIAQVMMRDYPEGLRSVVMDSPLPLAANYDEESVQNLFAAMDALFDDCQQDQFCRHAFPRQKERFMIFLEKATKDPLVVSVDHPQTGEEVTFTLRGKSIIGLLANPGTNEIPMVPLQMEKLMSGDFTLIKEHLHSLLSGPAPGHGLGMRLSVWCAEEFPFVDQDKVHSETESYPQVLGLSPAVFDQEICRIWKVRPEPASENQPVKSEIPVLLLNGSYDPDTPPRWAANMRRYLPNSQHIIFPAWSHGPTTNWSNPCGMETAQAFFNQPYKEPSPPCLNSWNPAQFNLREPESTAKNH